MKIISGGQTGVDRAALDAALEHGTTVGGWCPEGRKAEDGKIPVKYPLTELADSGYRQRTKKNIVDSDGTVIIYFDQFIGGTKLTLELCIKHQVRHILIDASETPIDVATSKICLFIEQNSISTINIAGPSMGTDPRSYNYAYELICNVLRKIKEETR